MQSRKKYYLGLDIVTDSVGYAVTDKEYNLLKFKGEPMWGVTIFDEASLKTERRSFRSARRRLDRRQQRVDFIQELFAEEIAKIDKRFFIRIKESFLYRNETEDAFILFNDKDFTDKEYYKQYPTIHHLISELMKSDKPHDVRLVYLACAWLVAHRGHFLSSIDKENLSSIKEFNLIYDNFIDYFSSNEYNAPWENVDVDALGECLKRKKGVNEKYKELTAILLKGAKPHKFAKGEEPDPDFPFSHEGILKLLAGGKYALKDLFGKEEYDELDVKSISLGMDEEKFAYVMSNIGEDYDIISHMRAIYDWTLLVDVLGNYSCISDAKVNAYEQHKSDLAFLKYIVKKYCDKKTYNRIFRDIVGSNYAAYAYHSDEPDSASLKKEKSKENFSKFILDIVKGIDVDEKDAPLFNDMISRLENYSFLPKQKNTDNRVIPHQLYWYELNTILNNAKGYLPFLSSKDESGKTVAENIESVFLFRVPYYVGPLNSDSDRAWLVRKSGKIYPWNFEEMVDLDESENEFIKKMTNKCTYLPGEDVLPKTSLIYQKFTVLNEINNLKINGSKIPVELKQKIYNEVFLVKKKVTRKYLENYLLANGYLEKGKENLLTGIDININSNLSSHIAFDKLIRSGILTEKDAERIIERSSYAEDKTRLSKWIVKNYPHISAEDCRYIASLKLKDFGRLSRKFLEEIEGVDISTGEVTTVISAMWNSQNNLMEIIADESKYTFKKEILSFQKEYYSENKMTLDNRLDDMYLSNAVRRPVYRTLDIIGDITKILGQPEKIFIEMTRGSTDGQKGKRTKSRKQQILELYSKCKDEDVRHLTEQLNAMGDYADNKLQGDKLFLYYMQLGKCMYSGKAIDLDKLATKEYDIDHIYPQAFVKDDSIINNKVLCLSEINGKKSDTYPIESGIRHSMKDYWHYLKEIGLISEEKYKRLNRATPFTEDEKHNFIARQLVETSQSSKAIATLLKEDYPDSEIVYCKAQLASEFRNEFDIYKSRSFNDLHHAADAYLNIVTGNVYNMKFTKKWFNVNSNYSLKTKTVFTRPVICNDEIVWDGEQMLAKVIKTAYKNNAHFTKYSFFKKGGFFNQTIYHAKEGLIPIKKGLPTEKYGGYNKAGVMFYIPVRYKEGKKSDIIIMSVELLFGDKFLSDENFAKEYCLTRLYNILGKEVSDISFPMGMRPWKVNTVLSLDGFKVCISGIGSGGKSLIIQPMMQLSAKKEIVYYIKKLESFVEKISANEKYVYSEKYDKISSEKNLELYDFYLDKLKNSIYSKRWNNPVSILENGREKFISLDIKEQARALMNILQTFGRIAGGIDLTLIGGAGKAATTNSFNAKISNWTKYYKDVRIIDSSASGLWEKKSENLLELL